MSAALPTCADVPPAAVRRLVEAAAAHPAVRVQWRCAYGSVTISAEGATASDSCWECEVHVGPLSYASARGASMRAAFVAAGELAAAAGEESAASSDYWAGAVVQDGQRRLIGRTEAEHRADARTHRAGTAAILAVLGELDTLWPGDAA